MDLVTVTHTGDIHDMIRQAKSIALFVEPCTHWVVINDDTPNTEQWHNTLAPYYDKHTLKLITFDNIEWVSKCSGYIRQQIYKLLISEYVQDDYVILDSKNFFVNSCSVNDFDYMSGSNCTYPLMDNSFAKATRLYSEKLGIEPPQNYMQDTTPFRVRIEAIQRLGDLHKLLLWTIEEDMGYSEFVLYSLIEHKYGLIDLNEGINNSSMTYMLHVDYNGPVDFNYDSQYNVKMLSVHRRFVNAADEGTVKSLNNMLERIGLQ